MLTYNDVLYLKLNEADPVNNKLYNGGVDALAFIMGKPMQLFSMSGFNWLGNKQNGFYILSK